MTEGGKDCTVTCKSDKITQLILLHLKQKPIAMVARLTISGIRAD